MSSIDFIGVLSLWSEEKAHLLSCYDSFIRKTIRELGNQLMIESQLFEESFGKSLKLCMLSECTVIYLSNRLFKEHQCDLLTDPSAYQSSFMLKLTNRLSGFGSIQNSHSFESLSIGFLSYADSAWSQFFQNSHHPISLPSTQLINKANPQGYSLSRKPRLQLIGTIRKINPQSQEEYKQVEFTSKLGPVTFKSIGFQMRPRLKMPFESSFSQHGFRINVQQIVKPNQSTKKLRFISLNPSFYLCACIVWQVFSIIKTTRKIPIRKQFRKTDKKAHKVSSNLLTGQKKQNLHTKKIIDGDFDSCDELAKCEEFNELTFPELSLYFSLMLGQDWHESMNAPLKEFHTMIDDQWKKIQTDHDCWIKSEGSIPVLLMKRTYQRLLERWESILKAGKEQTKS